MGKGIPIKNERSKFFEKEKLDDGKGTRLNKFLSNAGICARRKADDFIKAGKVTVDGKVVNEMGYRVMAKQEVKFGGKVVTAFHKKFYVLLNKPKNFITTTSDEKDRKTIMDLVKGASTERLYPVGRLDRSTTGLILLTNDGDLAQKLSHPSKEVSKLYMVKVDKLVTLAHLEQLASGVKLDDGMANADEVAYADDHDKSIIGIQIHSGRNRVVRRMFESLGYSVEKLDRVMFAGLTKKDLPRGKWKHLNDREIGMLMR